MYRRRQHWLLTRWRLLTVFLVAIAGVVGLWLVDVSQIEGRLYNGFWHMNTAQVYHIGLYLGFASIISLVVLVVVFGRD